MSKSSKKLTPRRMGREWALQFLYQLDIRQTGLEEDDLEIFWEQLDRSARKIRPREFEQARSFAEELIRGVFERREVLDEKIAAFAIDWEVSRMAAVDRNLLRLGAWEILFSEVPSEVAINEALEISKAFCEKDTTGFVNAILDQINKTADGGE